MEPTAALDSFYTDEVCPVEFLDIPFPKESITEKNAKKIPDKRTRDLWTGAMKGNSCTIRLSELRGQGALGSLAFDVSTGGVLVLQFKIYEHEGGERGIGLTFRNDDMVRHLPEHLWENLIHRSLHWVLRQHLSKLPDVSVQRSLLWLLFQAHSDNAQWYDAYDASVLWATFLLRIDSREEERTKMDFLEHPSHGLIKVGEALEAIQR